MVEAENSELMISQSLLVQSATISSSATTDTSVESTAPWYSKQWFRLLILRVLLRLFMLGLFFALIKTGVIPFGEWLRAYLDWINSLPLGWSLLMFSLCSILFSGFTPGSYAPTIVAGVTFPWYVAFPLSYVCNPCCVCRSKPAAIVVLPCRDQQGNNSINSIAASLFVEYGCAVPLPVLQGLWDNLGAVRMRRWPHMRRSQMWRCRLLLHPHTAHGRASARETKACRVREGVHALPAVGNSIV